MDLKSSKGPKLAESKHEKIISIKINRVIKNEKKIHTKMKQSLITLHKIIN